eukprot:3435760-Pyramimonas_sp.AAC.1
MLSSPPPRDDSEVWRVLRHVSDGACRTYSYWPEAARAGWGFAQIRNKSIDLVVFGPLPGPIQASPRAELFAVVQILRVAIPPLRILTDYLDLPQGLVTEGLHGDVIHGGLMQICGVRYGDVPRILEAFRNPFKSFTSLVKKARGTKLGETGGLILWPARAVACMPSLPKLLNRSSLCFGRLGKA